MKIFSSLLLALFLSVFAAPVSAAEKITNYEVSIEVFHDGSIRVTEDISVYAEGRKIKRGIYRDFPLGNVEDYQPRVPYEIEEILKDGKPENWFSENKGSDFRVYIGDKNNFLTTGSYTYRIQYSVPRAVLQWESYDEIYWNAIPTNWDFPMDRAKVNVILPSGVIGTDVRMFSGSQGAGSNSLGFTNDDISKDYISFRSTRAIPSRQGFTLAIKLPPDFAAPYPSRQAENLYWVIGSIWACLICGLFLVFLWYMVGRDPDRGVAYPRFEPPQDISPAASAYLYKFGESTRDKLLTTALISMASKGVIEIIEKDDIEIRVVSEKQSSLSTGEQRLLFNLSGTEVGDSFIFKKKSKGTAALIRIARDHLVDHLAEEYGTNSLRKNQGILILGLLATLATIGVNIFTSLKINEMIFFQAFDFVFYGFFVFFAFNILRGLGVAFKYNKIPSVKYVLLPNLNHANQNGISIVNSLFYLILILGAGYFSFPLGIEILSMSVCSVLLLIGFMIFGQAIKSPTQSGQEILSYLRGLHMYILHGEALQIKDELPEKTPKQFTSLYPYAFALGLEAEWAGQFESEMKHWSDAKDPETEWYRRDRHHRHGRSHRSFSENLSSSVSESANYSPPSKSGGGFSGGGSSGGGGGGGGGGGW